MGTKAIRLSIERKRAELAWGFAEKVKNNKKINYAAKVKTLPALIYSNGLANAMAFAHQKSEGNGDESKGWRCLLKHIHTWLGNEYCSVHACFKKKPDGQLIKTIISDLSLEQYRATRKEILALLLWLKRFTHDENSET